MNNIKNDSLDTSDLKYVQPSPGDLERFALAYGDVLFNRTNSKELVGKAAVFRLDGTWLFASYMIRIRLNPDIVRPEFVAAFLATGSGRLQIAMVSRQIIGMANVNSEELRDLQIPLPPLEAQDELLQPVQAAHSDAARFRREALAARDNAGRDLEEMLDLRSSTTTLPRSFVVSTRRVRELGRQDAHSFQGLAGRSSVTLPTAAIGEIAQVNPRPAKKVNGTSIVRYVGLPDCDVSRILHFDEKPVREVQSRPVAEARDTLFARIEPSIFNKKYVYVDPDLVADSEGVYTSQEFYVLRAIHDRVDSAYLWAVLHTDFVYSQIAGQTTGSSGRRRLPRDAIEAVRIPLPSLEEQKRLGQVMLARRESIKTSARTAEDVWERAKSTLEVALLGEH